MLRETSVIAVAGVRKLFFLGCVCVCALFAFVFIVIGVLKLLGLLGAMAMITVNGMIPAKNVAQNATIHIVIMLVSLALGFLFIHWLKLAARRYERPFDQDMRVAANLVNEIENNTRSGAHSLREAARSAVADAKSRTPNDSEK